MTLLYNVLQIFTGRRRSAMLTAFSVLVVTLGAGACTEDGDVPVVAEDLTQIDADNVVYGMTQILSREGVREALIEADTAYFFRDSTAVHLQGLEMTLFQEGSRTRAEVVAREGRLEPERQEMTAWGDVVLTIPEEDRRIRTEELHYSTLEERIWSDTATVMEEGADVTCGAAFRSDLEFRDVTIERARTANCP